MTQWVRMRERGSLLGMRIVSVCFRCMGRRAARLLLLPIVAYFFLSAHAARRASFAYLHRLGRFRGNVAPPSRRAVFRHMLAFAESALDKFAAWMGQFDAEDVDFPQRAEVHRLLAQGRGGLVIGSHLGNLEMMRALADSVPGAVINAVVYTEHAPRFNAMLQQANANFHINLIQVAYIGPETAILLQEKIERGELLVIVGDRTPPQENGRVCRVDFLGRAAPFAQGPMLLAHLLACPVYLFFCLREGGRYRVYFERFAERIELPRGERELRLRSYLQAYAARLQFHCLRAPDQWFNFYDFWGAEAPAQNPT